MQNNSRVWVGLVVGPKRDGQYRYDPEVKQKLVPRCMELGVSVARMAMQHGIKANLLQLWIIKSQGQSVLSPRSDVSPSEQDISLAFVPVQIQAPEAPTTQTIPAPASKAK